ncbi:phage tail spike protein [Bacillus toyonensis]|uniref:phage tail spike protein n=1 Tax=Bacillus toyonensis TaxID=155322 RepID=UPI0002795DE1|nr:phage tail spike protein [Bacillus toyonensis]EJQ77727.1 phage minor structural protein [Bacillus toyonensis]
MNRISGDLQIIDYTTQRVVATLQEHHYFDDVRHWEIKNTVDMLDFSVLENSKFVPYLQQQNLILKEVREGVIVPYVITEIEKDSARNILTVYASGLWTLLEFDPYIVPQKITGYTAQQWLSFATARTDWEVGLVETKGTTRSHEIKSFISPLALLHDISVLFDNYELQYRVTVQSGKIVRKYIDLVKQRGTNTGKEVTIGKDLNGIVRKENSENVITALVPFVMGQDAEGKEKLITIESVNNGFQYIVDEEAYQRWNVNGKHRYGFYTPQTEDQDMTPARLLSLAKTELKKRVSTIVSYDVDAVDIHTVFGLDHEKIEEGDTIRIIDEGMTPTLYLEARCIVGDESRRDPRQNKYTFGNYREIVDSNEELRKLYQKMLAMINDKVPKELMEAIENKVNDASNKANQAIQESKTAKDLAEATQDYMEQNMVDIIEQPNAPTTGLKDGKTIWVDTSNPEDKVQKLWKNGAWVRITPDLTPLKNAVADAQQDITNAETQLETAKQDIATTKTDLTNSKAQLQGEINTAKNDISTLRTDVNNKVDSTWVNQQLQGKADKSGVYTKDYIDQNLVGKQVYETDKQGNIQKFTDMNTSINQNAQAITNKAEKSEVTTLGNNLNQVSQKVNTVEQTANGNTQKITAVEGTMNTVTGEVNTLKTKTNTIENTVDSNTAKITSLESRKVGSDNLVKTGSDKMTILPKNTGDTSDNYNFVTIPVSMQMDREYTISARVKFTKGTDTKVTVYPYTNGVQTAVTIGEGGFINHTFKKTNVNTVSILLYAGQAGSTRDKGAEFTEIMVTEGNTVVAYAPPSPTLSEYTQKTNSLQQTVDTNTSTITSIQTTVNKINDDVTNLLIDSGTFEGAKTITPTVTDRWWLKNSNAVKISEDTYQGNVVAETQTAWNTLAYNFKDLINRGVVKANDKVTYSVFTRLKGASAGVEASNTFFFTTGATAIAVTKATNQWKRVSVTFTVTPAMMALTGTATDSFFRIEPDTAQTGSIWYQQSTPMLTIGEKVYTWKPAPEDNATIVKKSNEIKQTVDSNSMKITSIEDKGIVGTNLVYNSSFLQRDTGLPIGWTYTNSSVISYQEPWADESRAGVIRINRTTLLDTDSNSIISAHSSQFPVTLNTDYTFSAYMKVPNMATFKAKFGFIMEYYNASGTRVQYQDVTLTAGEIADLTAGKWTRIVRTLKPTTAGIVKGGMRLALFHNGDIYYRMPQVESGNIVTGWNVSTSDYTAQNEFTKKTSEITQTVDTLTTNLTSVTNRTGSLETKTNTIENTVNGQAQTITSITNRTGTLETKTNELRNDVDGNTSTITQVTQSLAGGNENYIIDSSANNVYPVFYDENGRNSSNATLAFEGDSLRVTCNNYTDAFYQIGATGTTGMHGFKAGDEFTLSLDLKSEVTGVQTIIYQHNGTAWTETEVKTFNNTDWTRIIHTFKLASTTKGWFIRVRFPRVAGANTKKLWIKNVKLEQGAIATPWSMNNVEILKTQNTIKQTTDSNTSAITGITSRTGTLETKTNTMQQTLDTTTSQIQTLTTTQGQHGTLINQQGTAITQLNNQIDLRVKTTEMQDYIGAIGHVNMISNSAFEERTIDPTTGIVTATKLSIAKWEARGTNATATVMPVNARHHEGYNSVKIENSGQTGPMFTSINQKMPIVSGSGAYIFSVWIYTDNASGIDEGGAIEMTFRNGSTQVSTKLTYFDNKLPNNTWTQLSVKLDAPTQPANEVSVRLYVRKNGRVWLSQPMVVQGTELSTFMENPKDITNYDQLIGEVAKKVATTDYNSKISTIESSITQQSNRIDLKIDSTDVYNKITSDGRFGSKTTVDSHTTQLTLMNNEINLRVKAGDISSTINQTAQSVLIQASKIYLDGFIEAKHLKAQELVGVTIKTAPSTEDRYVKLNRQFLEMYDKNTSRIQLRFTNSPFGTAITPTLIMGNSASRGLVGASSWQHWTYLNTNGIDESGAPSMTVIGVIDTYNSSNDTFTYGSQIRLYESGAIHAHGNDLIWIKADKAGYIKLETTTTGGAKPIIIDSAQYFQTKSATTTNINVGTTLYVTSGQAQNFESGNGQFNFSRTGLPSSLNQTMLQDDGNNADLRLAFVRIRSSHVSGYDGRIQLIPSGQNAPEAGLEAGNISYKSLTNRSSRSIKSNIRDLEIDSLEKIMTLKVQQYNFKSDVERLYNMRQSALETDKLYTTNDIPLQYGLILEDTDDVFVSDHKDGINLYTLVTLNVDATQKIKITQDNHSVAISQLKTEIEQQKLENDELKNRLMQLETLVQSILDK